MRIYIFSLKILIFQILFKYVVENTLKQCVPLQQEISFILSCIYYINRFAYGEKA